MDLNRAPRIGCYVAREMAEGRSWWTRIGSAFRNRDGSFTLRLDALPCADKGQATIMLREDTAREGEQG